MMPIFILVTPNNDVQVMHSANFPYPQIPQIHFIILASSSLLGSLSAGDISNRNIFPYFPKNIARKNQVVFAKASTPLYLLP